MAALVGRPVRDSGGQRIGRVTDIVVRGGHIYPPVSGITAHAGRRRFRVDVADIAVISQKEVLVSADAALTAPEPEPGPGEVLLVRHVLDHQIVDVDGARVVRASDLYVARIGDGYAMVGADASVGALLRRAVLGRTARRTVPGAFLDCAQLQLFGHSDGSVHLRETHEALHRLRSPQLAELLADLGVPQKYELLAALEPQQAAATLGRLDTVHLVSLLRGTREHHAADLLHRMSDADASRAIRAMLHHERAAMLHHLPLSRVRRLISLASRQPDDGTGHVPHRARRWPWHDRPPTDGASP